MYCLYYFTYSRQTLISTQCYTRANFNDETVFGLASKYYCSCITVLIYILDRYLCYFINTMVFHANYKISRCI